jgi:hypothetical protein
MRDAGGLEDGMDENEAVAEARCSAVQRGAVQCMCVHG